VVVLSLTPGGHEIVPRKGSARRVRDGEPADLTRATDYPAVAVCLICGQPIRTERYYFSEWVHINRSSVPES
jgi:hypothetical protein